MDNTLGIRIQNARKKAGLSQEILGEKLGVSRQAVSKWESDATIPEVDNLIAMSRFLNVPIGTLLGVDDIEPNNGQTDFSNNYEELKEILEKWSENYSETSRTAKVRGKQLVAVAVLFVLAIVALITTINGFRKRLEDTNRRISGIEQRIMEQIGSMEYSIQNILKEGASLVSDYDIAITSYDLDAKKYAVSIKVVLKEMDTVAEGKFVYSLENGENTVYATKKDGTYMVEDWILPMNKIADLTLVMEGEGSTKTALIERDFGVSEDYFDYETWVVWNYNIRETSNRIIKFGVMDGFINSNMPPIVKRPSKIEKIEAQIYLNQDKEPVFSEDISYSMKYDNLEYDDYIVARFDGDLLESPEYNISENDLYAVLKITEDDGNVFYRVMEAMEDGGSKMEFGEPGKSSWNPGEKFKFE